MTAAWQLGNEFQSNWQTKEEQAGVLQYGLDFLKQLEPVYTAPETKNGECPKTSKLLAVAQVVACTRSVNTTC